MTWVEGEEIARGATAIVRRGAPGTVVKTFLPAVPPVVARLEAEGSRAAMAADLPVPALLGTDLDSSPPSLTFSHVEGVSLASLTEERGAAAIGAVLAEVQDRIRQVRRPELIGAEDFHGFQIREADMPEALRAAALTDLSRLTQHADRVLCHMDLHDLNVLWSDGPVVIDWTNAMAAPAAADVARTRMLLAHEAYYSPDDAESLAALLARFVARTEELAPGLVAKSRAWDRVIAAARLDENPPAAERDAILRVLTRTVAR